MFGKDSIRKLLIENSPLIAILIGTMLVSFFMGPYRNGDTDWEYKAASGGIRCGMLSNLRLRSS
jgi:hypothetical protein